MLFMHYLLALLLFVGSSLAVCPHQDTTLVKWSSVSSWNQANAAVVIAASQRVLLDVSPPQLGSINISGLLVVNNANINLNVNWVAVQSGGSLIIGSTDCPITSKVIFTFFGSRVASTVLDMGKDYFDGSPLGSKGLAILTNATLIVNGYWNGPAWTRLASTAAANQSTIVLQEPVNWQAGDSIVIASTDYSRAVNNVNGSSYSWLNYGGYNFADQSEMVVIKSIVNGNVIMLTTNLTYPHWGAGFQKAEVGLLTRHVVFQGDASSESQLFGGHFIMRKGKTLQIAGAEFTRMGQKGLLARYPIHFHMIHDAIGLGYSVQQCSTHNNFQRGLVVHETHGVLVKDVVGYKTNGHMFILEEGGEHENTFDHVLGIYTEPISNTDPLVLIPTDTDVSIFWITNPNNTFINNAAVGGRFGFWLSFAIRPIGLSVNFYPPTYSPVTLPLGPFLNNVAHGSGDNCIMVDSMLQPDGTQGGHYGRVNPAPTFRGSTSYKCRRHCFWHEGDHHHSNSQAADCPQGSLSNGMSYVRDSVFVGDSDNKGLDARMATVGRCGFLTYDNGDAQHDWNNQYINFTNYKDSKNNTIRSGAHCPGGTQFPGKARMFNNTYINAIAINFNAVAPWDGTFVYNLIDTTYVSDFPVGSVALSFNNSINLGPSCIYRPDWPGYSCPIDPVGFNMLTFTDDMNPGYDYKLWTNVLVNGTDVTNSIGPNQVRYVITDLSDTTKFAKSWKSNVGFCSWGVNAPKCERYSQNLKSRKFYTFRQTIDSEYRPSSNLWSLNADIMAPGDWIFFSIPYPRNAVFYNVWRIGNSNGIQTPVFSFNQLNSSTYYYDTTTEHLWLFLKAPLTFNRQVYNDIISDVNNGVSIDINVTCGGARCSPTMANLQKLPSIPSGKPFTQDVYTGTLQSCQVVPKNANINFGSGLVQMWYIPEWSELHISIHHDLTLYNPVIFLGIGAQGFANQSVQDVFPINITSSPSRAGFPINDWMWAQLYRGNIYIQVNSSSFINGHLRAQIRCSGSCSVPTLIRENNPCVPTSPSLTVYSAGALNPNFVFGMYSGMQYKNASESQCGVQSLWVNNTGGEFQINVANQKYVTVDTAVYKYLEFYVKTLSPLAFPTVWLSSKTTNGAILNAVAVDGGFDSASGWQLARIPLASFGLEALFNVSRIIFKVYFPDIRPRTTPNPQIMLLDQVRFVAAFGASTNQVTSAQVGVAPPNSQAKYKGCYKDTSTRDLPTSLSIPGGVTVENCIQACSAQSFMYAGVQNGGQCWCGNTYGSFGLSSSPSECRTPCNGNLCETCGGGFRNNIYSTN